MKILFLCHRLPYPPNRGGKIRSFNMIAHLAQKHSVVVASLAHTEQELREGAELRNFCDDMIIEVLPDHIRWANAVKALPTPTPSSVAYFWSPRLQQRIRETLRKTDFDLAIVHCAFVASYALDCRNSTRILDYGDIDSAKWGEYAQWRRFPLSAGYALEAKKLRAYELKMAASFHHCTVTTHGEKEEFERIGGTIPCAVIPNGVDRSYFARATDPAEAEPVVAFLGRMDYFPNIDGVCYFAEHVFPIVRANAPAAKFLVIGSNPSRRVRNLARIAGISVTGHVPDVRTYLNDVALTVAPLRIARGTQNKILESMAMRIPVVATSQAAKGIQAEPGRHLLVADSPEKFAAAVLELLRNTELRRDIGAAARDHLEKAHSWSGSMTILDQVIGNYHRSAGAVILPSNKVAVPSP